MFYDDFYGPPHKEWDTLYTIEVADDRYDGYRRGDFVACNYCGLWEHEDHVHYPDGRTMWLDSDGEDPHEWEPPADTAYYLEQRGDYYRLVKVTKRQPDTSDIDGRMAVCRYEEWRDMTPEVQRAVAEGELKEYNYWRNGEVYAVEIFRRPDDDSDDPVFWDNHGTEWENYEPIDSCGGIIGDSALEDYITDAIAAQLGIEASEVVESEHFDIKYI